MLIPRLEEANIRFWTTIYSQCIERANIRVPFDNLDSGTRVLSNYAECDTYIALFGGHHFHKLYNAFARTKFQYTEGKKIEIIDWGCGQALATCVLIDYLIQNGIRANIDYITLIEPSSIALERGCEFIKNMFQNQIGTQAIVKTINKNIGDVKESDLLFDGNTSNVKVHLFSNIIDVEFVNPRSLHSLIVSSFKGLNRFVCTSPYNQGSIRLELFHEHFTRSHDVKNMSKDNTTINKEIYNVLTRCYEVYSISRRDIQFSVYLD